MLTTYKELIQLTLIKYFNNAYKIRCNILRVNKHNIIFSIVTTEQENKLDCGTYKIYRNGYGEYQIRVVTINKGTDVVTLTYIFNIIDEVLTELTQYERGNKNV